MRILKHGCSAALKRQRTLTRLYSALWGALLASQLFVSYAAEAPAASPVPSSIGGAEAPRAARSVHLGWSAPDSALFYLEMTVDHSTPGSYFMACGWNTGYFGIQELSNNRKVAIFSVWDPTRGDAPNAVRPEDRVELLHEGQGVRIKRFGGEGTGGQCMWDFPWVNGQTNRFLLSGHVEGEKTAYAGYLYDPTHGEWRHLVTFRTRTGGTPLKGLYSFIEDFRRDGQSVLEQRRARFGNGLVQTTTGQWQRLINPRFTASSAAWESKDNIDAGCAGSEWFLATGGQIQPSHPLRATIACDALPAPIPDSLTVELLRVMAADQRYQTRDPHDPDGIGKVYQGREIAHVMGHEGADWLERPEREAEEKPSLLLNALNLRAGEAVADIGAGSGYFSRRMAAKVGAIGRVYAVDVQQEMIDLLARDMAERKITNVIPVLGTLTNTMLPPKSIDLALMVDVYHEFSHPFEMMQSICDALRPGGKVVFVEYRAEDPQVPIKFLHKMSEAQVRKEMAVLPLDWVETLNMLPRQHIIVFRRK